MKTLQLFWARGTGKGSGLRNAGDWYSPLICERLSGRAVVYAPPHQCDLVAVGSLLQRLNKSHRLHRLGLARKLHVWGTGSLRGEDHLPSRHHVHAVRGVLTRDRISECPQHVALGDPGLLANLLIEAPPVKRHRVGVIPHLVDRGDPRVKEFLDKRAEATFIDVTSPVLQVLETIAACEAVLSSSLHGLVFADALGIPNAWFRLSDGLAGGRHKFDDYYSAFGLRPDPVRLVDLDLEKLAEGYERPGLADLKNALVSSFPCS